MCHSRNVDTYFSCLWVPLTVKCFSNPDVIPVVKQMDIGGVRVIMEVKQGVSGPHE